MNGHRLDCCLIALSGGSGTRLWPASRATYPKQFLSFDGSGRTLFQRAFDRFNGMNDLDGAERIVIGSEEHRFLLLDQMRELGLTDSKIIVEPIGKNTAPALTIGSKAAYNPNSGYDPILVVFPSDQLVSNIERFQECIRLAILEAQSGGVCTLGIVPTHPETGYGYIGTDGARMSESGIGVHSVKGFHEKPDLSTAIQYVSAGAYFWNSGIFVLRASTWLSLISQYREEIVGPCERAWENRQEDGAFIRPDKVAFGSCASESIDYAVMEPFSRDSTARFDFKVIPLEAGWSDLGAWNAVWEESNKDDSGNSSFGDVSLYGVKNSLVRSTSRLVTVVGVEDLVIVDTPDALLVVKKECVQEIKNVVEELKKRGRLEATVNRKVHRPWGWYDSIDEEDRFKVKRICVKPGASLSLQMHYHRAEHWVVVAGTAEVTLAASTVVLTENQSIYIPLGEKHRLANPGKVPLEIIEVQSGGYLGEDDIVRFSDVYGRSNI